MVFWRSIMTVLVLDTSTLGSCFRNILAKDATSLSLSQEAKWLRGSAVNYELFQGYDGKNLILGIIPFQIGLVHFIFALNC